MWSELERAKGKELSNLTYHKCCKHKIQSQSVTADLSQKPPREWHKVRDISTKVYSRVCEYITENVIKNKQCVSLSSCQKMYIDYLKYEYEKVENLKDNPVYPPRYFEQDLLKTFTDKIEIERAKKKNY